MTTLNNSGLRLRPATDADRAPTVAWCNTLWDGERDYIEHVWEYWQAEGNLFVGTLPGDDDPVALLRMRRLSPTEAWFGGLRVHPTLQGRGTGKALIGAAMEWARERGATTLGYMTETDNERMHHLGAALGFARVGGIDWHRLAPLAGGGQFAGGAAIIGDPAGIDVGRAANLAAQGGRYFYGWAIQRLTPERLRRHADEGELVALADGGAWMIFDRQDPGLWHVSHAEGNAAELRALFAHALAVAAASQREHAEDPDGGGAVLHPLWEGTPLAAMRAAVGLAVDRDSYSLFEIPL